MEWQTVAQGVSIWELEQTVADMYLPKGAKLRIVMDTWADWAFDIAGAELVFKPFIPEGLDLIDVYGENGQGIVDMEADPVWLAAALVFIKAHWLAITIAGFALATLISFIYVMVKVPAIVQIPFWLIVGAVAGVAGVLVLAARKPKPKGS